MAHVAKLTRAAAGHLCKHYERARDENGEYLRFGNQDIDPSRSAQNYNLAPDHAGGQMEFIQKRCREVKCLNRKDVNVMCSWIVTAPQSIAGNSETEKSFFDETYKFLQDRYGKENTVSAHVHMDEITPHMHFAFVPVVEDKKNGKFKVSAKEVVDRLDLQSFHTDLDRHLCQTLGEQYLGGILNGATKDGNRSIEELKRQSAADRLAEAERDAAKIRQDAAQEAKRVLEDAQQQVHKATQEVQKIRANIKPLQQELKDLQGQTRAFKGVLSSAYDIENMGKKSIIGDKITFNAKESHDLKEQAMAYWAAKTDADKAGRDADRQRQRSAHLETLDRETVPELRKQVRSLTAEKNEAIRKLNKALTVIDSEPELAKTFDRQLSILNQQEKADRQKRERSMGYDLER